MEWMFLPLKRYAEFSGRSRRMEYWMFALFQFLLSIVFWFALAVVGGAALMGGGGVQSLVAAGGMMMILFALFGVIALALIIPAFAVAVRRLHDTNHSGWWLLAPIAPYCLSFVGLSMAASSGSGSGGGGILIMLGGVLALALVVVLLVFMLLDGTRGPNRFGADPKGREHGEVFA